MSDENGSECALCPNKVEFRDGGWTTLAPFVGAKGVVCVECTQKLTMVWAREYKRKGIKPINPTPTNSPAGAGTPYVEQLAAVA